MKRLFIGLLLLLTGPAGAQVAPKAEYFINTDPGVGKATSVSGFQSDPGGGYRAQFNVPLDGLQTGIHNLHVRVMDDEGRWGLYESRVFLYTAVGPGASEPAAAEYFIDNDPGVGKGTPMAIGSGSFSAAIPTDGLSSGIHNLHVRARDAAGRWGFYESRVFLYTGIGPGGTEPVAAEYFIDNDPGVGKGMPLAIGNGSFTATIPTEGLSPGIHNLHVRARDAAGRWGLYESRVFLISEPFHVPDITAIEYFIDEDPGQGDGTPLPFTSTASSITLAFEVATDGLEVGTHTIHVRAKNAFGWGLLEAREFTIADPIPDAPAIQSVDGQQPSPVLTRQATPAIAGTAEGAVTVQVFAGDDLLGATTSANDGSWVLTPGPLDDGTYLLTAIASNPQGKESEASNTFEVTIDTEAPAPPAITAVDGRSEPGFATANSRPEITGAAEADSQVDLYLNGELVATLTADADGLFRWAPDGALADGPYEATAMAEDAAGNRSEMGQPFAFRIDTQSPGAPEIVEVDGQPSPGFTTSNTRPEIRGHAEAGATVEIFINGIGIGTVTADGSGAFRITTPSDLDERIHTVAATATDGAGNEGMPSSPFVFTVAIDRTLSANNVLTPNGDGKNDVLKFENIEYYPQNRIHIFDRAGRVIFSAAPYQNEWNGRINGVPAAEGTYYYQLDPGDGQPILRSYITVIIN